MVDAPVLPRAKTARHRRPALGYAMLLVAATLFAVNGSVSKVILASDISPLRLTEVRLTGAALCLLLVLALVRPASLRLRRNELVFLICFGVGGLALTQWLYFIAIHRLPIGIALLIQFLAPLIVALWARYVMHRPVRRRIWVALALCARRPVAGRPGLGSRDARRARRRCGARGGRHVRALHPPRRARRR